MTPHNQSVEWRRNQLRSKIRRGILDVRATIEAELTGMDLECSTGGRATADTKNDYEDLRDFVVILDEMLADVDDLMANRAKAQFDGGPGS